MGAAQHAGGHLADAMDTYRLAEEALGAEPKPPDRAWWQAWGQIQIDRMLVYNSLGRAGDMVESINKTVPVLEQWGTLGQRLSLLMDTLRLYLRRDRYVITDEVLELAERTLETGLEAGDLPRIAEFRFAVGFCRLWRGELATAQDQLELARREAERIGDPGIQVLCLTYLAVVWRQRGQIDETRQTSAQCLELAQAAQMPTYEAMAQANLAWVAWREGRFSDVQTLGRAALDLWRPLTFAYPFQWAARWPLMDVALARGQLAEAVDHGRAVLDPQQQQLPEPLAAHLENALASWDEGRTAETRCELLAALDLARESGGL
jgi:hypothetical protein